MSKITRLCLVLVSLIFFISAKAEIVTNYLEKFDNQKVELNGKYAPFKWGRIADPLEPSGWSWASTVYVSYKNPTVGGQDGAFLEVGTQSLTNDDNDTKAANDYLVTPAVGGVVSFYLKKQSAYSDANLKIYECTKNGDTYTVGTKLIREVMNAELSQDLTQWTKITLPAVADGSYLAMRFEYMCIDEFATERAEIIKVPSLRLMSCTLTSPSAPLTDANNQFEVAFDVKVENNGEVELVPGMEGYSITMFNDTKTVDVVTVPIEQKLAVGASAVVKVSAKVDAGDTDKYESYKVRENFGKTVLYGSWIDSKPYLPVMEFCPADFDMEVGADEVIDFGMLKDNDRTRKYRIRNTGMAPLNVTEITLPEGYTTTLAVPVVVAPKGEVALPITLSSAVAGTFNGKLKIVADLVAAKEYSMTGAVIDKRNWYENFEGGVVPANMLFGNEWEIVSDPSDYVTDTNKFWAENGNSTAPTMIVSPKLKVQAGEALNFRASKRGDDSFLKVYYSSDRVNWQLAKEFVSADFSDEKVSYYGYGNYKFSMFTVNTIPAGEWYVAIEGGYARVDDIFGYELAAVDHDVLFWSLNVPAKGKVNNQVNVSAVVKNMAGVEAADSYTLKAYYNNELLAELATPEIAATSEKTFEMAFTPHEAGTFPIYFEFATNGYVVKSEEAEIVISEEVAEGETKVGAGSEIIEDAPVKLYSYDSEVQTIYTAEQLGLTAGAKITKLIYSGYSTAWEPDQALLSDISIYIENTTDAKADLSNPRKLDQMTRIYKGMTDFTQGGSAANPVDYIVANLAEPFEYTGQNLRIAMTSSSTSYKKIVFFADPSTTGNTIYKSSDWDISTATWYEKAYVPAVSIFTAKEPRTLSGKVYSKAYGPLPNVKVKLISGDVLYSAVTDAQGHYEVSVIQSEKDYKLIIDEVVAYDKYEHEHLINLSEGNQVLDVCITPFSGVEGVESNKVVVYPNPATSVVKVEGVEAANITLMNMAGAVVLQAEGVNEINVEDLAAGIYMMSVQTDENRFTTRIVKK